MSSNDGGELLTIFPKWAIEDFLMLISPLIFSTFQHKVRYEMSSNYDGQLLTIFPEWAIKDLST